MLGKPVQGGVQLFLRRQGAGLHRPGDLPITLAVNADLRARIVALQYSDGCVTAGDQVNGRGIVLTHEVKVVLAVIPVLDHALHVVQRRDHLRAHLSVLFAIGRVKIKEREIVRRDAKGDTVLDALLDSLPFLSGQGYELFQTRQGISALE